MSICVKFKKKLFNCCKCLSIDVDICLIVTTNYEEKAIKIVIKQLTLQMKTNYSPLFRPSGSLNDREIQIPTYNCNNCKAV